MNYFKRKMLGYVFRCGGGEGGDGSGDGTGTLAGLDAAQFGTTDAPAGATGVGAQTGSAETAPASPAPTGIIGSASPGTAAPASQPATAPVTAEDRALAEFDSGKSSASSPAIGGSLPTAGGLVADATGSKTLGSLANLGLSATPLGPLNAALGLGNLAIGAINELSAGSGQTAMNGPALVGNSGVGAAQAIADGGFNNQTGEGGVPAPAGGSIAASGEGGNESPTGIIGSASPGTVTTPAAPSTPPTTAAAPDVNYSLFGSVGMGGWSSAARRYAAKKGQVRV